MAQNIRQRLANDLLHFSLCGEKTPLLFFSHFLDTTINLPFIVSQYRKSPYAIPTLKENEKAAYYRFYRLFHSLEKEGLVKLDKRDHDLLWATPQPAFIDLFRQVQNSNPAKQHPSSPFSFPSKARPERIDAIKTTALVDMLSQNHKEQICSLFEEYLEDINNRVIVLRRIMNPDEYGQRYFFLDYQTRFNSKARKKLLLDKYEAAIKKSLDQYKVAVHLVLTTDPKRHKSLWHANRHFSIALNKFFSFLKKRLGYRPAYLAVYEFTKSGLLHCHILIFGKSYLLPHHEITKEWERCGQGSYNFIYSLKKTKNGWQYKRQRPSDCEKGQTAEDYLKKYLKKAQFDESLLFLYWVFNKRFYTCSRKIAVSISYKGSGEWLFEFVGSFSIYDMPAWLMEELILEQQILYPPKPPPPDT